MRVPLGWLSDWIALPAPQELAQQLTMAGLEVDAIEHCGPDLSPFRVGEVLSRETHPNADRLSVCQVDLGDGEPVQIVCGAPNVAAGQKVAVARVGTTLGNGVKLKNAKIRGVKSQGMICADDELGLGDDHDGIRVLEPEAPVGATLDQVLPGGETVLEVAVLPNRGDCLSMLGMAREVRALFGGEIRVPESAPPEPGRPAAEAARVEIEAGDACHAYVGRVVRGVRIEPSPEWLRQRLEALGVRPINVVVDVTNLVLFEFGQPLHAFDLKKLSGARVRVRMAQAGERIVTLDGVERALSPRDLVIADAERAIALAGVMGSSNSEVDAATTDVLIESAHFAPAFIRHTGRRLGLLSDASYRFERGVDAQGVLRAADRAARLLAELAGGEVAAGALEARGEPAPHVASVRVDPERVNRLLGTQLAQAVIEQDLERVGVRCVPDGAALRCEIPSHRNDLTIPEDLIEEVARIQGLDRIPSLPMHAPLIPGTRPPALELADRVRDALVAEGLLELVSLPFMDPGELDKLKLDDDDPRRELVRVENPIVESNSHLRSSLLPTLLRTVSENANRQVDEVALFEVSRVFLRGKPGELPDEPLRVAAVVTRAGSGGPWRGGKQAVPLFFEVKGILERLMARLGREVKYRAAEAEPYLHPGVACKIIAGADELGAAGGLHPDAAAVFGILADCVVFELDLERIGSLPERGVRYREVSAYPSIRRDLAVLVDRGRPAEEVLETIRRGGGGDLVGVEIFDRYAGGEIPEGKVSLAFRLTFQRLDRTLEDAEVTKRVDRVVRLLAELGGTLR